MNDKINRVTMKRKSLDLLMNSRLPQADTVIEMIVVVFEIDEDPTKVKEEIYRLIGKANTSKAAEEAVRTYLDSLI